jgi:hypothetical protein
MWRKITKINTREIFDLAGFTSRVLRQSALNFGRPKMNLSDSLKTPQPTFMMLRDQRTFVML